MNHTFCIYSMRFAVNDARLQCFDCPAVLSSRQALSRHKREMHGKFISKFQCPFCNFRGSRQDDVLRVHIRKTHPQRYRDVALRDILDVVEEREEVSMLPEEVEDGEIREGTKAAEGVVFPVVPGQSAVEPYSPAFMNGLAKTYPPYPTGRNVVPSPHSTGERPHMVVKVTPKRKNIEQDPTPEKRLKTKKPLTTTRTVTNEQPLTTTRTVTNEQPLTTTRTVTNEQPLTTTMTVTTGPTKTTMTTANRQPKTTMTTTNGQPKTTMTTTTGPTWTTTTTNKPSTIKHSKTISSDFGSLPMIELGTPVVRKSIAAQTGTKGAGYRSIETQCSPSREIQIVDHSVGTPPEPITSTHPTSIPRLEPATITPKQPTHIHKKTTKRYPDGTVETTEEFTWYTHEENFACCDRVVGRVSGGLDSD